MFTLIVIAILLLRKNPDAVRKLILSTAIALLVGTAISAVIPAVGPWSVYPISASSRQALCEAALLRARSGGVLDLSNSKIICFPSFHVCFALLSAYVLGRYCKPLRFPGAFLAGLIIVSTITLGWHYYIDVLGGVAIASFSFATANISMKKLLPSTPAMEESPRLSGVRV